MTEKFHMILDYLVNNIAQVLMESMAASFVCPNWQVTIVWTLGIAYSGIFTLWSDLGHKKNYICVWQRGFQIDIATLLSSVFNLAEIL